MHFLVQDWMRLKMTPLVRVSLRKGCRGARKAKREGWLSRVPVEHVGDHFDFCLCGGEFFGRGGLRAASAKEVRHRDRRLGRLVGSGRLRGLIVEWIVASVKLLSFLGVQRLTACTVGFADKIRNLSAFCHPITGSFSENYYLYQTLPPQSFAARSR